MVLKFLSVFLFTNAAFAQMLETIEQRKNNYQNLRQNRYGLLPHRAVFLMPVVYNWLPHEDIYERVKDIKNSGGNNHFYKKNEAEFQVSFAIPVVKDIGDRKWDFMFAYTHHAYWQVYNSAWSRPFRETNYMPELFSRYIYFESKKFLGFGLHSLDAGYIHQSNGQIQILSRSWDRFFIRVFIEGYGVRALVSAWYRLEDKKEQDDNPDIYKYMGYGELEFFKSFEKHSFQFKMPIMARHQSFEFNYSRPMSEGVRWFASYQSGYGHSLIEYNRFTQRFGLGFLLDNILY